MYDARSAGFWPGEGCGLVVLMRAADAVAQGRRIYALIRGWGISSDGSGGITRPEVEGQKLALERAYRRAGFTADTVGFFEGHGTGTAVGDATELRNRVRRAIKPRPAVADMCAAIGSIKANMGHTKAAAGVAGLLKATLALHHQMLPPSIGWEQPHAHLTAEDASIELLRQRRSVAGRIAAAGRGECDGIRRDQHAHRAGSGRVASTRAMPAAHSRAAYVLHPGCGVVSVRGRKSTQSLDEQVRRVASYAAQLSFAELGDLAAALARSLGTRSGARGGRCIAARRIATVARHACWSGLADDVDQRLDVDRGIFLATAEQPPSIGFLFPGQGTAATLDGGAVGGAVSVRQQRYDEAALPKRGDAVATEIAHPAIITASVAGLDVLRTAWGSRRKSASATAWASWPPIIGPACSMTLRSCGWPRARPRDCRTRQAGRRDGRHRGACRDSATAHWRFASRPRRPEFANANGHLGRSGRGAEVVERAHAAGLQAVRLSVSHAFHSPLIADAVDALVAGARTRNVSSRRSGWWRRRSPADSWMAAKTCASCCGGN